MDQLDVTAQGGGELFEVWTVDGDDLVAIDGEQGECSVDDIGEAGSGEQLTCCSPERFIKGTHVDAMERLRESGLARAAAPRLAEHAGMGERDIS